MATVCPSTVDGLILLFGVDADLTYTSVPVLVVYGAHDRRFRADYVRETVENLCMAGSSVDSVSIVGDHFALLKRRAFIQASLRTWLAER